MHQEQFCLIFYHRRCADTANECEKLSKLNVGRQGHTYNAVKAHFWHQQRRYSLLVSTVESIKGVDNLGFEFYRRLLNQRAILTAAG